MTLEEAKQEIPDFDTFANEFCNACTSDAYCSFYCDTLKKAERIFDRVQVAYARHDGDMVKVDQYIKKTKGKTMVNYGYADIGKLADYANNTIGGLTANDIMRFPRANVQPVVYAHKTINVGRRSYCSNCGELAIMEDFCSKCGAKVKDDAKDNNVRNLTDEETAIYESWIESEAKDTGVNIMDGDAE
jgi:hypothetical protein